MYHETTGKTGEKAGVSPRDRLPMFVDLPGDRFNRAEEDTGSLGTLMNKDCLHSLPMENLKEPIKKKLTAGLFHFLGVRYPFKAPSLTEEQKEAIRNAIQPGDIILTLYPGYPGWQLLEQVAAHSNFTHAALYEGEGKVLESLSNTGITRTELDDTLTGASLVEVLRPPYKTGEDREALISYARSKMGTPYDNYFNTEDDKELYCSELLYWGLKSMPNSIEVVGNNFMGRKVVGPQALETVPGTEVVFTTGATFMKGLSFYKPVIAGTATCALAGAAIAGPVGFVAGAALGWASSILIGNKAQTGQWGFEV